MAEIWKDIPNLFIDLETYSRVDITKCGLYRYAQSPDFQIMLLAYAWDDQLVQIIDLMQPYDPTHLEIIRQALQDPAVIKHAYNAPFEWYCLNRAGFVTPINQWRCTMAHGLYCGYTAGLGATGEAIGIPQDKRKLGIGKSLINTFCKPCKPTAKNGQRTRTLPHHEPEKWELFKTYCMQDVAAEREIERRLSIWPMPEKEQQLWELDAQINAFGVAADRDVIAGALHCGNAAQEDLMKEAVAISGLDNPKSVQQLTKWLEEELDEEITDLRKDTVAGMLEKGVPSEAATRMLEIRQQLGKTSTKKYDAMERAICDDGRIRGLAQYYGANRTGRWCLTGDHELLTDKGWIRLDAWHGGKIACWNPLGETVSFQEANAVCFPYSGDMYEYCDKRIAQVSTPDHRMYHKRRYGGDWCVNTVENMAAYRPSIPFTGYRRTASGMEHSYLRVLVMVQADGHYTAEGNIRLGFSKSRKVERCKALLRSAGIQYALCEYADRSVFTIFARHMPMWLRMFHDKTFDPWLFDESADVFFEELAYWDGYRAGPNSIQYVTCNRQNADMVQAFAHITGRCALVKVRRRSENHPKWRDAYVVDIWLTPINCHEIKTKPTKHHHDGNVYCAETPTGFFLVRRNGRVWVTGNSGRLVQVQNLPRNYMPGEQLDFARELVKGKRLADLRMCFDNVPDTLSQLIRTAFIPSPGHALLVADFSAIEARVIAWLAQEKWRMDVFATHGKIYEASASAMFGVPLGLIKKGNPEYELRQKGKVAELALGYGGSTGALIAMGALDKGLTEDELPDIVHRWRDASPGIVRLWYAVERAAIDAVESYGQRGCYGLLFTREGDYGTNQDFLTVTLPSGRKLFYARPTIEENKFGRPALHYMGVEQGTKKWAKIGTFGGKLTENIVQAIARDCLAEILLRLCAVGHQTVFHVHDEAIIDSPVDCLGEVLGLMAQPIEWAPGLLLKGDGSVMNYYRKE